MEWYQVLIVCAVAFVATYAMVPVSKRLATALGAIDYPGGRRINTRAVPRCGGIALYVGLCAGIFTLLVGMHVLGWEVVDLYEIPNVNYAQLFVGVSLMFAVGLVDDIIQLKSAPKFVGQIVAAVVIVAAGVSIGSVRVPMSSAYISYDWLDAAISVLYLLVFVNITNLVDGLDGLAAGLVAIVAASLAYLMLQRGAYTMTFLVLALIAVCVAFLRYNIYPASIFMGDSGSHLLGVVVGIVSVVGVARAQGIVSMLVPLVLAAVPVLDTCFAIVRRLRAHQPVGKGDTDHVHHRLLKSGMGQRRAVAVLWALTAVLAVVGIAIENFSGTQRVAVILVLAVGIGFVSWKFGLFGPVLQHHYSERPQGPTETKGRTQPFRPQGGGR